jgi:hypothetical protein
MRRNASHWIDIAPTVLNPRRKTTRHLSQRRSGGDGLIVIGPMLPELHPINSANRPSFGLVSSFDLLCRPMPVSAICPLGYMPVMLFAAAFAGAGSGKPSSLGNHARASIGSPASGPIICSGS